MALLYPPNIEGLLPAFAGSKFTINFSMNKAVAPSDVTGIYFKFKDMYSDRSLTTAALRADEFDLDKGAASITLSSSVLDQIVVGQHYKAQIAYADSTGQAGYYSSVGVFKRTAIPELSIKNLNKYPGEELYSFTNGQEVIGVYENADINEKVFEYCFELYNNSILIESSGWLRHNINSDELAGISTDVYSFTKEYPILQKNSLIYRVRTINGLQISSNPIRVITYKSIDPTLNGVLNASNDLEEGCINIWISSDIGILTTGQFELVRASEKDDYSTWQVMSKFYLVDQEANLFEFKDYTVEQGIKYRYAIRQYNQHGFKSNHDNYIEIQADFEYAYLFDGERQLKIKYNAKVSSFKDSLLEQKTNTLGSKYPYIFRNGNVRYHEFPIAGLISCQMDEANKFLPEEDVRDFEKTANWIGNNFEVERKFKLSVLDWLNNGKPKLFRSPGEGNYIVRLMNSSLTPIDQIGRMIHNFSTSAVEIMDYNYDNMVDNRIIDLSAKRYAKQINGTATFNNGTSIGDKNLIYIKFVNTGNTMTEFIVTDNKGDKQNISVMSGKEKVFVPDAETTIIEVEAESGSIEYVDLQHIDYPHNTEFDSIIGNVNKKSALFTNYDPDMENIIFKYTYMLFELRAGAEETTFKINGNLIDLAEIKYYEIDYSILPKSLVLSSGVKATVSYWYHEVQK